MTRLPPALFAYLLFLTLLLGLVFGSFGNAWAWRLAHGEKISRGRSHCAECGHVLAAGDLIPLFSFLFLRGRCRYCGKKISPRYPIAEALCATIFLSFVLRYGLTPQTLEYCILGFLLFTLSLVDFDTCTIPDRFLVLGAVNFAAFACFGAGSPVRALLTGLAGGLALAVPMLLLVLLADRVMKRETMGGGDIKLLFVLGLYTGPTAGLFMIIIACIAGLIFAFLPAARGGDAENPRAIPFGPALSLAAWLTLLFSEPFLSWYFGLF